jgi:hypothetical protein
VCRVSQSEKETLYGKLATALATNLVKSLRKHIQSLPQHLLTRFTTAFEEEDGVRRPWTSNLKDDARAARQEVAQVLAQLALVPAGFNVPGVAEGDLKTSQVPLTLP